MLNANSSNNCCQLNIYEQDKFHAQQSMTNVLYLKGW